MGSGTESRINVIRECERCTKEFTPTDEDQKYCSKGCKRGAEKVRKRMRHAEESCARKDGFATQEIAHNFRLITSNGNWRPVAEYQCPACGQWHITSRETIR